MFKLKRILAMIMCAVIVASVLSGCRKIQEDVTDPVTEPVTEAETEPVEEEKGDPTYGYFETGSFSWNSSSAVSPEMSFYCDELGNLYALSNGTSKKISSAVESINGIMSKVLFITTSTGLLNAIDYDGNAVKTIGMDTNGKAILNPDEMIVYYGKGEDPVTVYGYNLKNDNEATVYTDTKIYSGISTDADDPFVYAMDMTFSYDAKNGVDAVLYYPYGSEFPYERYIKISNCKVTYDDHEHTDENGNPPSRTDYEYIYYNGEIKYACSTQISNGDILSSRFVSVSSHNSEQNIDIPIEGTYSITSYTSLADKLFCITRDYSTGTANLWMLESGSNQFTLVKEGTQVEQVFSWNNKLYALAIDNGKYVIFQLDENGKYISTLWTASDAVSSELYTKAVSAGRYVIVQDISYVSNSENLEGIKVVFDLENSKVVA